MQRARWWRNPKIRTIIIQVVFVLVLLRSFYWLFSNTINNLDARGIITSFSFLDQVAPFQIAFSPFLDYILGTSTYIEVFAIGVFNTVLVAILGVLAATLLGFVIGVMRISPNWLVCRIATVYIETIRNVPLLLQLFFWNFAIFLPGLPSVRQSFSVADLVFLNNRGLYVPSMEFATTLVEVLFFAAIVFGIVATIWYSKRAKRIQDTTGKRPLSTLYVGLGLIIGIPILVLLLGSGAITYDIPELKRFNFVGGITLPLPLFVLWFGLSIYTAAFIAENVRGGINAVSHGQTEAARSLGLGRRQILKLVVIPQAMRVIIPPTISQYLNLTKNSSLAVAVSYEEIVSLWAGISLNQTGQALIIIAMTVVVYELLSLGTSLVLNWYNKRVQLIER